jgi:hypothetical protein
MSTVHGTTTALRRGDAVRKVDDVVRSTILSPQYFPTFLGVSMVCSFVGGFVYMESLKQSRIPSASVHLLCHE